jgi:hypothetical protein
MQLEDTAAAIYARAPTAGSFYVARNVTQYCLQASASAPTAAAGLLCTSAAWRGRPAELLGCLGTGRRALRSAVRTLSQLLVSAAERGHRQLPGEPMISE